MKKPSRHGIVTVVAAVAGLCIAVALAVLSSHISAQRIGLAGESPTIGRQLVATPPKPDRSTAKRKAAVKKHRKAKQTATTPASRPPAATPSTPSVSPAIPSTTPSTSNSGSSGGSGSGSSNGATNDGAKVETHTTEDSGETHTTEVHTTETGGQSDSGREKDDD